MNTPIDYSERSKALSVSDSFLVISPAGSGKTELLTQRFLALLSIVNEPEEILAITFTNKAAFEMRSRIINALLLASLEEPELPHLKITWELAKKAMQRDSDRNWNIIDNPNRLRLKTIDAFCGSIVKSSPISSLMGTGNQVADNSEVLYSEAAQHLLNDIESDSAWTDSLIAVLDHVDNRFDRSENLFVALLQQREHWLPLVIQAKNTDDLKPLMEFAMQSVTNDLLSKCHDCLLPQQESIVKLSNFAADNLPDVFSVLGNTSTLPQPDTLHASHWALFAELFLTKDGKLRKSVTAKQGFPAPSATKDKALKQLYTEMKSDFKSLMGEFNAQSNILDSLRGLRVLPPLEFIEKEWGLLDHLMTLLPILAAKLLLVFQRNGVVDYSEVSTAALRVLGDDESPTDLALILDSQLKHILVDEFQDTNYLQISLLEKLTAGWERDDGRTMFFVGDPMQSIYGFRGSNVGLFLNVGNHGLGQTTVKTLNLKVNFRSSQNIVDWTNQAFSTIFPKIEDQNIGAITYSPSVSGNDSKDDSCVNVLGFSGDQGREQEAKWLSTQIQSIRSNNGDASIAILVRNRSHLEFITQELKNSAIPHQALEISPLSKQLYIRDLVSLTRAVCHLGDRTAWLSLLRSPLCGLKLTDLEKLSGDSYKKILWEQLKDNDVYGSLSDDGQQRVSLFTTTLNSIFTHKDRKSLATMVNGLWLRLNGPSTLSNQQDLDNVSAFFNALSEFEYATFDHTEFGTRIERLYASPGVSKNNPVQIMTIHKSKGLQFDHVFIPALDRTARPEDKTLLAWDQYIDSSGQNFMLMTPTEHASKNYNSGLYRFIRHQKLKRVHLERARLLYVGCTRAKTNLYLSGAVTMTDDEITRPGESTLFGMLWPAISNNIEIIQSDDESSLDDAPHNHNTSRLVTRRLAIDVDAPELESGQLLSKYRGQSFIKVTHQLDHTWEINHAKSIGIVIHRTLRRICLDGPGTWTEARLISQIDHWKSQLLQLGVPQFMLSTCAEKVKSAITNTLASDYSDWLLDNTHKDSSCELSICFFKDDELCESIIDRSFIDDGVRWIIDYKTGSTLPDETVDDFIQRQINAHTDQLQRYADHFKDMGETNIKAALFFPDLQLLVDINNYKSADAA